MPGELDSLGRSPELFPHSLDPCRDTLSFIHLTRDDYDRASFLDARILTPGIVARTLPWQHSAAAIAAANLTERCDYIFHIGHVGSTLLSRLIGAHSGALALREPLILRTLAQIHGLRALTQNPGQTAAAAGTPPIWNDVDFEARLSGCVKLLSRTFAARQRAVVKATSFVSELAQTLLSRPAAPRAVLLSVSPESYLATILGGPNSRQEANILAPDRLRRLNRRIGRNAYALETFSEGEAVALGWACEMSALAAAGRAAGERTLRVDFDQFLARPGAWLHAVLRHLRLDATTEDVAKIIEGPHLQRYSKAPEYAYDAGLRLDVLNSARALHGVEIARGLRWLDRAAATFKPIGDALTGA